jgi:acetyltransferase-like isoleucine patch superfamily enzyme
MSNIAQTAKIHPGVTIGDGADIGEFCIIGVPPKGKAPGDLETRIGANAVIRSHTVIYAGNTIGDNFNSGHAALVREQNRIGDNVSIGSHTVIEHHVEIQDGVRIHSQAFVPEFTVLEKGCWIGPHVVFTNALHPLCAKAKQCLKGATVKTGAKVGANSTILPDLTIGEMAVVGAGSVVVKDVPDRAVVAGSPAAIIKSIADLTCPYGLCERPYDL